MSSNSGNRKSMDDVLSSIRRIIGTEKQDGDDAEHDDVSGEGRGAGDHGDGDSGRAAPLTLGAPIGGPGLSGGEAGSTGGEGGSGGQPGDPLSLTPNMRVDFSKLGGQADDDGPSMPPRPGAPTRPSVVPSPEELGGADDERDDDDGRGPWSSLSGRGDAGARGDDGEDAGTDEATIFSPRMSMPETPAPAAESAPGLDEAALEEMVRRVLREELEAMGITAPESQEDREEETRRVIRDELMGETGQNISRNVTRLIKFEVERILDERKD